jgi:23S rRNA (uracil1939-C5)-methyltransferase
MRIVENLTLTDIAEKGFSIGRDDQGRVVFVEHAVPGDIVDVRVFKKRKGIQYASPIKFHQHSPDKVLPFCQHFEYCGGCQWQHLDYKAQIVFKEKIVRDALERVGKIAVQNFEPILGASISKEYRNKLEFTFANKQWLSKEEMDAGVDRNVNVAGFYHPGVYDKVLNIEHCHLQKSPSNELRLGIKELADSLGISFYDLGSHSGCLRNIVIRITTTGEILLIVFFGDEDVENHQRLLTAIKQKFPQITSLHFATNTKLNSSYYDLPIELFDGKGFIEETLGHVNYRIGPKSFFQTNSYQAGHLYELVAEMAQLSGKENVYDLYTGIGSIGLFLAKDSRQIVGIEEVPEAIEDAKINAEINQINNAVFFTGDVKNILQPSFVEEFGSPDVLITDPPRAGMHPDVVKMLLQLKVPRMVYVSCKRSSNTK